MRIENHWVAPDYDFSVPALTLSTRRFWNVLRLDLGDATVTGEFQYHYSSSMDGDIIHTQNDSAVLVYRANSLDSWHTIPYTIEGNWNWKAGTFIVNDLQTGQYSIAAIDKSIFGMNENILDTKPMIVAPNPTESFVKISSNSENSEILIINSLGQAINSFPISDNEITISIETYPAGVYFVNLLDEKKNIISTEKLVKK